MCVTDDGGKDWIRANPNVGAENTAHRALATAAARRPVTVDICP